MPILTEIWALADLQPLISYRTNFFLACFYVLLQNGALPYSSLTFLKLWIRREAMGPLIFLKALCEPDIEWRTGRFRLQWGGKIKKL